MDWNCMLTEERLSEVLEGALAPEEREACAAHTSTCAGCSAMLARVGEMVSEMHGLGSLPEPRFLARRIIQSTLGAPSRGRELTTLSGWLHLLRQPRFAMGLATVAASLVILAHAAGPRLSQLTPADLNPARWVRAGNRQVHLTYARGEKFVNDLRVVYEIRAMLATQPSTTTAPGNGSSPGGGTRPDTGRQDKTEVERQIDARIAGSDTQWAALFPALRPHRPRSANRRPL